MGEVINPVEGWAYPANLPQSHCGFALRLEHHWDGLLFRVFSYHDDVQKRSVMMVFDKSTAEFMLRLKIGLTEFCDVEFIHADLSIFEGMLKKALLFRLETMQKCMPERMGSLFRSKKILEWSEKLELPAEVEGFELYVRPETCVQVTNGSYLIIDYSNFPQKSSLRFFYNIFRDDFYAEYLIVGAPMATSRFDASSLHELMEKIHGELQPAIAEMHSFITKSNEKRMTSIQHNG